KRLGIALGPRYEVGKSSSAAATRPTGGLRADYGFFATMDREIMHDPEREVGYGITDSWDEIVETLQGAPLLAGRLNMLFRDRCAHAYTRHLMETEARMSREAWVRATDASDLVHGEEIYRDYRVEDSPTGIGDSPTGTAAYGMSWKTLMKMMTEKYCPRNEIRKLEIELWDLKVKGTDLASYTQRFQELALLCRRMFSEESDKIEKYIGAELMDKKIRTFAKRETASKRKSENTLRNTQNQQQHSNKRQITGWVYTAASGEKKQYGESKPLCAKCNYHHDGPCAPKCRNCNRIGHFARDCRNTANTNNANNQRGPGLGQKAACYECGVQGHFKRECPKLKNNNNHGNQGGRNNAPARVYTVGRAGTDPDAYVMTGTFLLNNRYASILFDTGVDRSFASTTFSTQINITPSTLDHCYDVELADERIIGLNTILRVVR
nr:hypothetical protein [Tanacetum cinerariifolium]